LQKVKVYLDNCCFNRPYDDQTQLRIELETKAKLFIQQQIVQNDISMVSSVILEYENNDNPYPVRKYAIKDFLDHADEYVDENTDVVKIARDLNSKGIRPKDASHLACAIYADCHYFISTDDRLLKYTDSRIRLINPIDFIKREKDE